MTVYFIQPVGGGPIKIGATADPIARLQSLMAWSPMPLVVLASAPGGIVAEGELHHRFRASRSHGEWFWPSDQLLGLIADVKATGSLNTRFADVSVPIYWGRDPGRLGALLRRFSIGVGEMAEFLGLSPQRVQKFCRDHLPPRHVAAVVEFLESKGHRVAVRDLYGPPPGPEHPAWQWATRREPIYGEAA